MGHDIGAPLEGTAVHGRGEGVIHDQGHAVGMGRVGEALDIEYGERGICDAFAEDRLGVGAEGRFQLLVAALGVDEGEFDAHLRHGHGKQVEGAAIDGAARDHMVAAVGDVEYRVEVGSLAARGEHGCGAAFQLADLSRNGIVGGVLQAGVEIAFGFQVEELAHCRARLVAEGGGLHDGYLAGLAISGPVTALHAHGSLLEFHGCAFRLLGYR